MMIVTLVLFWMWVQYSREKNALVTQASKAS
jgi:hypothetical protein